MTDDLFAPLEAAAKAARVQQRLERHTPVRKAKASRGRAQKARGYRAEKRIEAALAPYGFARQPLSGALGGRWAGDLARVADDARDAIHRVEVKHRERGWATLQRWLAQGAAHLLVLDQGAAAPPLAVLELATLAALLREAGYV